MDFIKKVARYTVYSSFALLVAVGAFVGIKEDNSNAYKVDYKLDFSTAGMACYADTPHGSSPPSCSSDGRGGNDCGDSDGDSC